MLFRFYDSWAIFAHRTLLRYRFWLSYGSGLYPACWSSFRRLWALWPIGRSLYIRWSLLCPLQNLLLVTAPSLRFFILDPRNCKNFTRLGVVGDSNGTLIAAWFELSRGWKKCAIQDRRFCGKCDNFFWISVLVVRILRVLCGTQEKFSDFFCWHEEKIFGFSNSVSRRGGSNRCTAGKN